jgi:hypothetical protein
MPTQLIRVRLGVHGARAARGAEWRCGDFELLVGILGALRCGVRAGQGHAGQK